MKNTVSSINKITIYVLFFTLVLMGFTAAIIIQAITEVAYNPEEFENISENDFSIGLILASVALGLIIYVSFILPQEIMRMLSK